MSTFKPGDRVHVEFDAEVSNVYKHVLTVMAGGHRQDWGPAVPFGVPNEWCSLLDPPLKVGDVITNEDPEPPLGTIIRGTDNWWAYQSRRLQDGIGEVRWQATGEPKGRIWAQMRGPHTVLFIPEVDQ